jgi:hypothetical protein
MGRYLVELYMPRGAAREVALAAARAKAAAIEAGDEGIRVRCLRSIYVPEDETWFLLYDAPTAGAVKRAVERAELQCGRVVEALAP